MIIAGMFIKYKRSFCKILCDLDDGKTKVTKNDQFNMNACE